MFGSNGAAPEYRVLSPEHYVCFGSNGAAPECRVLPPEHYVCVGSNGATPEYRVLSPELVIGSRLDGVAPRVSGAITEALRDCYALSGDCLRVLCTCSKNRGTLGFIAGEDVPTAYRCGSFSLYYAYFTRRSVVVEPRSMGCR